MNDGLAEDKGSDTSLEAAAAAINSLYSGDPEEKPTRDAPPAQKTAPSDTAADTEQAADEEKVPEQEKAQDPPTPEPRKLKVKLPDGEQELPEDEVVKGYLRTADYTRKTQEVSEKRKALETEAESVRAERQRYATQLAQLDDILSAAAKEPDWDTLREGDPAVFAATYAAWDQHQKQLAAVKAERARADDKVKADQRSALEKHLQGEAEKLIEAIPEWKDAEKAKTEKGALAEYARSQGYTDEELAAVTDHRVIKILRDAMMFRQQKAKAPEIEKKIEQAKVMAPGPNAPPKRDVSDLTRAKQALAKTGSLKDAGAAIALLFDDE